MKLFYGGTIVTMTNKKAEAVLTDGDTIRAVGSFDEIASAFGESAEHTDLSGNFLLPGFIDSHSHFADFAKTQSLVNLSGAESIDEILERLLKKISEKPKFVAAFGYDDNELSEQRHPLREEIDEISGEIPVILSHESGHMGVANSAALELMGISEETKNPSGGVIGRTNGRLNGYLEETAFTGSTSALPPLGDCGLMERAQKLYFENGITTAQEGRLRPDTFEMLKGFSKSGNMKIDIVGYADLKCTDFADKVTISRQYENHLRIGGFKIFLDGSPQGKTAWFSTEYRTRRGYCGYPSLSEDEILKHMEFARHRGAQLLAHANGDLACAQLVKCAKKTGGLFRPVMIHSQFADKQTLEKMPALDMTASFFISHIYKYAKTHEKNLGRETMLKMSPLRSAIDFGVNVTLHRDTPVMMPSVIDDIFCAVSRRSKEGEIIAPEQKISPEEAISTVTKNAAWQYGEEKDKGALEVGKKADFVILHETSLRPLETIKDGETVYRSHHCTVENN